MIDGPGIVDKDRGIHTVTACLDSPGFDPLKYTFVLLSFYCHIIVLKLNIIFVSNDLLHLLHVSKRYQNCKESWTPKELQNFHYTTVQCVICLNTF